MQENKPMVVIMRAHSGAGKSTWIRNNLPDAVVCSADNFFLDDEGNYNWNPKLLGMAHSWCVKKFREALEAKCPVVVVDNTNLRKKDYEVYVSWARQNGYEVFQKRLTTRFKNTHGVPEEKVDQMIARFEEDASLPHFAY